jgi:predicted heme/steroid binding protein
MSIEEIRKGNGKDGNPTYFTLNGKVREYNLEGF